MTAGFARKRPRLPSSAQVALDYLFEKRRTRRRGFVAMTMAELGAALGKSASQARRIINVLADAGQVLAVYNGGQGRRRACVFYIGALAAARAREQFPEWDAKTGEKPTFPRLRMGKVVLEQRLRKARKNAGLTASGSLGNRGGVPSGLPPLGDPRRSQTSAAESDAPPHRPPTGGPMPAPATVVNAGGDPPCHGPTLAPSDAQNGSKTSEPLSPAQTPDSSPRGAQAASRDGSRSGPSARSLIERRTLVCRAWGEWRERYRKAKRRDYRDHPGPDGRAMTQLVHRALLRARHDHEEALRWLCSWFRDYLRDRVPPGSPLGERHHPLFRLVRLIDDGEYRGPDVKIELPKRLTAPIGQGGLQVAPDDGDQQPVPRRARAPANEGNRTAVQSPLARHRKVLEMLELAYRRGLIKKEELEKQRRLVERLEQA